MRGWWLASYLMLWALVVVLCLVVVSLARQVGVLHLRLGPRGALELEDEGPELGEALEPFSVTDLEGRPVTISGSGDAKLLLFVSPGCPLCDEVLPSLSAVAETGRLAPVVIADADGPATSAAFGSTRVPTPIVPAPDLAAAYRIPGTPYAVLVGSDGVVWAKGTVNTMEQMEGLVETASRRQAEAAELEPIG